jgi:hypothetical protein
MLGNADSAGYDIFDYVIYHFYQTLKYQNRFRSACLEDRTLSMTRDPDAKRA